MSIGSIGINQFYPHLIYINKTLYLLEFLIIHVILDVLNYTHKVAIQ
ncbi:hypothetical protein [Spirosoma pollinicola]|nr:hypothetical protein [Spirosoma pollinicola]